jgi:hypothetical protein
MFYEFFLNFYSSQSSLLVHQKSHFFKTEISPGFIKNKTSSQNISANYFVSHINKRHFQCASDNNLSVTHICISYSSEPVDL